MRLTELGFHLFDGAYAVLIMIVYGSKEPLNAVTTCSLGLIQFVTIYAAVVPLKSHTRTPNKSIWVKLNDNQSKCNTDSALFSSEGRFQHLCLFLRQLGPLHPSSYDDLFSSILARKLNVKLLLCNSPSKLLWFVVSSRSSLKAIIKQLLKWCSMVVFIRMIGTLLSSCRSLLSSNASYNLAHNLANVCITI